MLTSVLRRNQRIPVVFLLIAVACGQSAGQVPAVPTRETTCAAWVEAETPLPPGQTTTNTIDTEEGMVLDWHRAETDRLQFLVARSVEPVRSYLVAQQERVDEMWKELFPSGDLLEFMDDPSLTSLNGPIIDWIQANCQAQWSGLGAH